MVSVCDHLTVLAAQALESDAAVCHIGRGCHLCFAPLHYIIICHLYLTVLAVPTHTTPQHSNWALLRIVCSIGRSDAWRNKVAL